MANNAKKSNKDNKNMIIGICAGVAAIVVIVVLVVVLVARGGGISDDYFKSDDTKYVLTVETDESTLNDDEKAYAPVKTHVVYTYSGDEITGMKTYAEYKDSASAKKAYDLMKEADASSVEGAVIDGKYIVATGTAESYEGMTASDVKSYIEFMDSLQNMNLDDVTDTTEVEETETVEED